MQIQELSNRILPLQDKGHWKNSMSNSINIENVKDTVMLIVYLCQTLMLLELSDCCGTAKAVDIRKILIELNEYLIFSGHPVLLKFVHSRLSVRIKTVIS